MRVHSVPRSVHRAGRQNALCGVIPTDPGDHAAGYAHGRWAWTDDPVTCRRCQVLSKKH